jgi:hypothetical protein
MTVTFLTASAPTDRRTYTQTDGRTVLEDDIFQRSRVWRTSLVWRVLYSVPAARGETRDNPMRSTVPDSDSVASRDRYAVLHVLCARLAQYWFRVRVWVDICDVWKIFLVLEGEGGGDNRTFVKVKRFIFHILSFMVHDVFVGVRWERRNFFRSRHAMAGCRKWSSKSCV